MVPLSCELRTLCVSCIWFRLRPLHWHLPCTFFCPHVSRTPPLYPRPAPYVHDKTMFAQEKVSHYSQCSHRELVNAAARRWSGVSNVLEAVLVNSAAIERVYVKEGKDNPLAPYTDKIKELYSLIKPVAELIATRLHTRVPTGQARVIGLAALTLTTFNVDSSLDIRTPARKLAQGGVAGAGNQEQKASSAPKQHADLTMMARQGRVHFIDSVNWRWFKNGYHSEDAQNTDFVFDMQIALHPTTVGLDYVDKLASTPEHAVTVKTIVTDKVIVLAVELAQKEAEGAWDGTGGGTGGEKGKPAAELTRSAPPFTMHPIFGSPENKQEATATARFASLGLFKEGGGASEGPSFEKSAHAELKTLRAIAAGTLRAALSCEGVLMWWKRWGSSYPLLARVARAVSGAPASAAVLERDFSDAGRMMTSSRSTTDTWK